MSLFQFGRGNRSLVSSRAVIADAKASSRQLPIDGRKGGPIAEPAFHGKDQANTRDTRARRRRIVALVNAKPASSSAQLEGSGTADTCEELAEHWEQMRGHSRLSWSQARPVVEDAWRALDHIPAAAREARS